MEDENLRSRPLLGYEGLPEGPGYEAWREEFCRRVMHGDLAPLAPGIVRCAITALPLPRIRLSGAAGTPMEFLATGKDHEEALALVLADAPMSIAVGKRSFDLEPLSVGLADAAHKGANVSQLADGSFKSLFINRKALLELAPDAEDRIARQIEANPALVMLLKSYYTAALEHGPALDVLRQDAISRHLLDLVLLLLGGRADDQEQAKARGLAAARFESIKAEILRRLSEGALNVTSIAKNHGISPRYVHLLFEKTGVTFSEFVLEQRLLQAHRMLRDPLSQARKISEIAYLCGFNDVSYFNQTFRRRYGMTPSDARRSV